MESSNALFLMIITIFALVLFVRQKGKKVNSVSKETEVIDRNSVTQKQHLPSAILQSTTAYTPVNVAFFTYQRSERVLAQFNNVKVFSTKTSRNFVAGSRGISIRVAKGISFRIGNTRGRVEKEEEEISLGYGPCAITTKHIYYSPAGASKRIALAKIVSVNPTSNGVRIVQDGVRARPVELVPQSQQDRARLLSLLVNSHA